MLLRFSELPWSYNIVIMLWISTKIHGWFIIFISQMDIINHPYYTDVCCRHGCIRELTIYVIIYPCLKLTSSLFIKYVQWVAVLMKLNYSIVQEQHGLYDVSPRWSFIMYSVVHTLPQGLPRGQTKSIFKARSSAWYYLPKYRMSHITHRPRFIIFIY